jgi:hypothetical protein
MTKPLAILAGFASDLDIVESGLPDVGVCFRVDDKTPESCVLPKVEIVVYVFSEDTGYSSQLLSWFTWIHHSVGASEEYVMKVGNLDLARAVFDFAKGFSVTSIAELQQRLKALSGVSFLT